MYVPYVDLVTALKLKAKTKCHTFTFIMQRGVLENRKKEKEKASIPRHTSTRGDVTHW
jgi:hypothetical protein